LCAGLLSFGDHQQNIECVYSRGLFINKAQRNKLPNIAETAGFMSQVSGADTP
jgi:hypothetical protein